MKNIKAAFITNLCPHYRVQTFEYLADNLDTDFYFYSAGKEWYWQQQHGVSHGRFNHIYLPGLQIGHTRVTPALVKRLWHHPYDVYIKCINGRFALPATYAIARLKRKPFILWTGIWTRLQSPIHRMLHPLTQSIYRSADALVVYGEHVKRFLVAEGVEPKRIFVAAHAIDNQRYGRSVAPEHLAHLRTQLALPTDAKVVLYLGRLEEVKGLPWLLNGFAAASDRQAVLVLVGTGSDEAQLRTQAQRLNITDRVRFAGYVPADQAIDYYALATVFVLPSITVSAGKETWGLVVNEAFNQGVPVIATDAVGAAAGGLVQHGVTGLVVPERNSQALADALSLLLGQSEVRNLLGRNALTTIKGWDNQRMIRGFLDAVDYVASR